MGTETYIGRHCMETPHAGTEHTEDAHIADT